MQRQEDSVMKKYLSKKYIKYIGSLCAVWAALWNVFLLGVSLEKSGPAADSTLLQCILGSENYAHDFFTRQFWFISVFVFYMAVYLVIFLFLQHESGKYRSMKLHRYGKKGYLNHCESKVLHGSLYAVLLVATGLGLLCSDALQARLFGQAMQTWQQQCCCL